MNPYFFVVFVENGESPLHKFPTLSSAEKEAKRLAKLTDQPVWVLSPFKKAQLINGKSLIATPIELRFANYINDGFTFQEIGNIEWPDRSVDARRMQASRVVHRLIKENPGLFKISEKSKN